MKRVLGTVRVLKRVLGTVRVLKSVLGTIRVRVLGTMKRVLGTTSG